MEKNKKTQLWDWLNWLTERRLQLREGTQSILEMDNKGEMGIVPLFITGKETSLVFIMTQTKLLEGNCVNIFLSQVIWFVAHVSII